jgi:hypothetical protein
MRTFIIGLSLVLALTQVAAADQQSMAKYTADTLEGCKNFVLGVIRCSSSHVRLDVRAP